MIKVHNGLAVGEVMKFMWVIWIEMCNKMILEKVFITLFNNIHR